MNLIIWWAIGLVTGISITAYDFFKHEDNITVGDLTAALIFSLFGPVFTGIVIINLVYEYITNEINWSKILDYEIIRHKE